MNANLLAALQTLAVFATFAALAAGVKWYPVAVVVVALSICVAAVVGVVFAALRERIIINRHGSKESGR